MLIFTVAISLLGSVSTHGVPGAYLSGNTKARTTSIQWPSNITALISFTALRAVELCYMQRK
jgi:hypothetical protein